MDGYGNDYQQQKTQQLIILFAFATVCSAVVLPAPYQAPYPGAYPYAPAISKIAAPLPYAPVTKFSAPVIAKVAAPEPYDPNPQYSFSYDVHVSRN